MTDIAHPAPTSTLLLIGASRGLGHAMAAEFLKQNWSVVATARAGGAPTPLHALAAERPLALTIESLDICKPDEIAALHGRLKDRRFDMLFVNAGVTNDDADTVADVTTDEFNRVMITNALSPMRVIEALQDCVSPDGLIGVMSSGQGSVSRNETGLHEVYRSSKAALNMFMRSYAARQAASRRAGAGRPLVLMAPGWVRTDLGGAGATLRIEDSIPKLVQVLLAKRDRPGLEYLDYLGRTVPW